MAVQGEDTAVAASSPLVSRADQSCLPFLLSAHSNSDAVAGLRLRPLGFTSSSAMNSAQENSVCTSYRKVSADTMKLLLPIRRGAGDDESVLGMRPNQIAARIGAAARQAGLSEGYSGDSSRLGMIKDMEPGFPILEEQFKRDTSIYVQVLGSRRAGKPTR